MSNGDPDYPPDPPAGKCGAEHDTAVSKYFDMKTAESNAINAAKKARDKAAIAAAACAAGAVAGPLGGLAACIAAVGVTVDALNDAKSANDVFGIAIQRYIESKQTLLDCISLAEIVIEPP